MEAQPAWHFIAIVVITALLIAHSRPRSLGGRAPLDGGDAGEKKAHE